MWVSIARNFSSVGKSQIASRGIASSKAQTAVTWPQFQQGINGRLAGGLRPYDQRISNRALNGTADSV
jgi:hypothetical protein